MCGHKADDDIFESDFDSTILNERRKIEVFETCFLDRSIKRKENVFSFVPIKSQSKSWEK